MVRAGLEPGTAGLQVRYADHSTMLSLPIAESLRQNSCNKIIIACKSLQITSVDTLFRTHFLMLFAYLFLFHIPLLNLLIKLHNVLCDGLFFHLLFLVVTIQLRVSKKNCNENKTKVRNNKQTNKQTELCPAGKQNLQYWKYFITVRFTKLLKNGFRSSLKTWQFHYKHQVIIWLTTAY